MQTPRLLCTVVAFSNHGVSHLLNLSNCGLTTTVQYKILEGENFSKFGKLQEICQIILSKIFPS